MIKRSKLIFIYIFIFLIVLFKFTLLNLKQPASYNNLDNYIMYNVLFNMTETLFENKYIMNFLLKEFINHHPEIFVSFEFASKKLIMIDPSIWIQIIDFQGFNKIGLCISLDTLEYISAYTESMDVLAKKKNIFLFVDVLINAYIENKLESRYIYVILSVLPSNIDNYKLFVSILINLIFKIDANNVNS